MEKNINKKKEEFHQKIIHQCELKEKNNKKQKNIFLNIAYFGVLGWMVTIPVLLGLALGNYLDRFHNTQISWSVTLLFVGIVSGCINAWFWIKKNRK